MANAGKTHENLLEELTLLRARIARLERAEEALRRSQASLANAERLAHLGSWEWDVATREVEWSDEVIVLVGARNRLLDPFGGLRMMGNFPVGDWTSLKVFGVFE